MTATPRTGQEADAFVDALTFDDTATLPSLPRTAAEGTCGPCAAVSCV
ncbi:hypothetical protein [Nocardia sp. NPDC046763]